MSEQDGARPTVALVHSELRGIRDLLEAKFSAVDGRFTDVQRQLDLQGQILAGLPSRVTRLEEQASRTVDNSERLAVVESRLDAIETSERNDREWLRGPALAAAVAVLTAVLTVALAHYL